MPHRVSFVLAPALESREDASAIEALLPGLFLGLRTLVLAHEERRAVGNDSRDSLDQALPSLLELTITNYYTLV